MRTILLAVLLAAGATTGMGGCSKAHDTSTQKAQIPTVTVDEVDHQLAAGECVAVDANGETTRKKLGVVPGAVLLTSSEDIAGLPADKGKSLVFYCANTHCGASHTAAEKALTAGYTHVKVMPEGIAGWVKAGKQVQKI